MHHPLFAVGEGRGVFAELVALTHRFDAVQLDGVVDEARKEPHRIGAAADAGHGVVGQFARHLEKLLLRLDAHDGLEVAHHSRERVWPDDGTDGEHLGLRIFEVSFKHGIDRLFEGFESVGRRNHLGPEDLHAHNVGMLFFDVHFAHVNLAHQPEISRGRRQRHTVLPRTCLCDKFLLPQVFRQQRFGHTVVELMRAGMVQVFADFAEGFLQLRRDKGPAEFAEKAVCVRHRLKVRYGFLICIVLSFASSGPIPAEALLEIANTFRPAKCLWLPLQAVKLRYGVNMASWKDFLSSCPTGVPCAMI